MLKNKRVLWITLGVLFIVVLFFIKRTTTYTNDAKNGGLVYGTEQIGTLVNRDSDQDGLLDWEEGLWGTDPTKKDTDDDGILDSTEIQRRKEGTLKGSVDVALEEPEILTQTDIFSRELFSTVAALTQNGALDQDTIDSLGISLAGEMGNSLPRKVYSISQIKVITDNSATAMKKYNLTAGAVLYDGYYIIEDAINVIQESIALEGDANKDQLDKLNPIIAKTNKIINGLLAVPVPKELSYPHLGLINSYQKFKENLENIKLIESDPIVAMGSITQYIESIDEINLNLGNLSSIISSKLNN